MGAAAPVIRLYPALGNASFLLLWLGMMPATFAVMMNQVAGPYAAFTLSNSAAVLGVVSLAQGVPMLLLSLLGGVVADRLPRRLVLMGSQMTLGLGAGFVAAFALAGALQVWHIIAASFLQGAAFAFNMPARQAYIAELVPRTQLANAAALNNAGQNFCRVAGPALGGVLLGTPVVGIGGAFLTMAVMYIAALLVLFRLPGARPPMGARAGAGGLAQVLEGLRYARSSGPIVALILMNLVVVMFGMSYQTLMPVVAERVFVALLAVVGFLFSAFSALNNTLLMANTEPRLTGRVMSIYLLTWGAMPFGSLPLAWLADRAGAPVAIALAGAIVVAAVLGIAVLHPPAHRIGWVAATASAHRPD